MVSLKIFLPIGTPLLSSTFDHSRRAAIIIAVSLVKQRISICGRPLTAKTLDTSLRSQIFVPGSWLICNCQAFFLSLSRIRLVFLWKYYFNIYINSNKYYIISIRNCNLLKLFQTCTLTVFWYQNIETWETVEVNVLLKKIHHRDISVINC